MKYDRCELVEGPHDGSAVIRKGCRLPGAIYTPASPPTGSVSLWACEPSPRFPAMYVRGADGRYRFAGYDDTLLRR